MVCASRKARCASFRTLDKTENIGKITISHDCCSINLKVFMYLDARTMAVKGNRLTSVYDFLVFNRD